MESSANLLSLLYPLARRQGENFVTAALTHLIRLAQRSQPDADAAMIRCLTADRLIPDRHTVGSSRCEPRLTKEQNRYDIVIESTMDLVHLEAKVDSPVDLPQLAKYKETLSRSNKRPTLVLLTKYPNRVTDVASEPDVYRRWFRVAGCIEQLDAEGGWPLLGKLPVLAELEPKRVRLLLSRGSVRQNHQNQRPERPS